MKLAIMQPYLFPYLGYYQLAAAVDQFIFLDDVGFIKRGFINRNSILSQGKAQRISFPVRNMSQNRRIMEHCFVDDFGAVLLTLEQSYTRAPYFDEVFSLVSSVLKSKDRDVTAICQASIVKVMEYLEIPFSYGCSSAIDYDRAGDAESKLISICSLLGATAYINAIGGLSMYSRSKFAEHGVDLCFIDMNKVSYDQGGRELEFVPNLSMIDIMMWCGKSEIKRIMGEYRLI